MTADLKQVEGITNPPTAYDSLADIYRLTLVGGPIVAVKRLRQGPESDYKDTKRTARELTTWAKLDHPRILKLLGLAELHGQLSMVSPWMEYSNVISVVSKWPIAERYALCEQLIDAVAYLHGPDIDVVHGDIKGGNVLMDQDGHVKLTGFGLAAMRDHEMLFSETDPGGGTTRWMAPELFTEDGIRCRETDIYALGMTMFEVLTGSIPFPEIRSRFAVIRAVAQDRHTPDVSQLQTRPLSAESSLMVYILSRCWTYEPDSRATVGELKKLAPILGAQPRTSGMKRYETNARLVIGHTMPLSEVTRHLINQGCQDITETIVLRSCSELPLAGGGFGDIYRGRLINGAEVAIKCSRAFIDDSDESRKKLKRMARELYFWSKLKHENVLELLGLASFRGQIAMISPWMRNGDIVTYLRKWPKSDRCCLSRQVANGLAYIHDLGTIHGDLKGLNVLIADDGTAKITDFGNIVANQHSLAFTTTNTIPGYSARWAAPEILRDESTLSVKADIYALGMTILEIITGNPPYNGKRDHVVMALVATKGKMPERPEDSIPVNSQGNALWDILTSCWLPDPGARPNAIRVRDMMKLVTQKGLEHISY